MCHHTREPTVLSRVNCRPSHLNVDRFRQPCLLPGRTSRIGEDCHPRTTWRPLEVFATPTKRYHGRALIRPSPPCVCHSDSVCTHAASGPSRVRSILVATPFLFCKIDTRELANIHKAIACKYPSNNICTVVGEWHQGFFCLQDFFSSTRFDLVTRRKCGGIVLWFLCTIVTLMAGRCIGLLSNTGLFLSTGYRYRFLLQRHSFPADS